MWEAGDLIIVRTHPRRSRCRLAKTNATRPYAGRGLIESCSPDKSHLTLMPVFILPFPAIDPVAISVGPFIVRWRVFRLLGLCFRPAAQGPSLERHAASKSAEPD
jgi:hypothetical protein